MKKISITLSFEDEKLDALEFSLKKENSSVQQRMDDALKSLYEKAVPEPVREYLDSRAAPAVREKAKRPAKPTPKSASAGKPITPVPQFEKEAENNG